MAEVSKTMVHIPADLKKESKLIALKLGIDFKDYLSEALKDKNKLERIILKQRGDSI